jgi:chaperonin GroES
VKLYGDQLLVRLEPVPPSGVILMEKSKEKPMKGEVIAVGPGRVLGGKTIPLEVKVGDTVLFTQYAGTEVKDEEGNFLILREHDVLAVLG